MAHIEYKQNFIKNFRFFFTKKRFFATEMLHFQWKGYFECTMHIVVDGNMCDIWPFKAFQAKNWFICSIQIYFMQRGQEIEQTFK